jgi:hypothetical protein
MGISAGLAAFKLSFQLSPIILTGGIASGIPGGALPIISITEALNFVDGLLSGGDELADLDGFFANFHPLPGASIIEQRIGEYTFANQVVAANAVIRDPLLISLRMICPARDDAGYAVKLATMIALQATLAQHNASGGTYTVATPSFFYTNCVMLRLADTSNTASRQAQNAWQWDFKRPLLTLEDAQQAQNNLMSQISSGTPISGQPAWSGLPPTVGNFGSIAAPSVVPAAAFTAGSGTAAPLIGVGGPFQQAG